jgi:hypothetical protein
MCLAYTCGVCGVQGNTYIHYMYLLLQKSIKCQRRCLTTICNRLFKMQRCSDNDLETRQVSALGGYGVHQCQGQGACYRKRPHAGPQLTSVSSNQHLTGGY